MEGFTMQLAGMDLVHQAQVYAIAAHAAVGQRRKYTNEPYIVHPGEVAAMVAAVPGSTPEMVAAAWLHDVVEDTGCTLTDIHLSFGPDVAALVGWLTDVSRPEDGNRAVRKARDREHTARAPAEAQTIKLADLISNSRSIMAHDPKFAKVYLEEKRQLLEVLTRGDPELHARATALVADCSTEPLVQESDITEGERAGRWAMVYLYMTLFATWFTIACIVGWHIKVEVI